MSLKELSIVTRETNDEPKTKLEGSEMTHEKEFSPVNSKLYGVFKKIK